MIAQTAVLLSLVYLRMELLPEVMFAGAVPFIGYHHFNLNPGGNNIRGRSSYLLPVRKYWEVADIPVGRYSRHHNSGQGSRVVRSIPQFLLSRGTRMQRIFRPFHIYETFTSTEWESTEAYIEFQSATNAFAGVSKATLKVIIYPSGGVQLALTLQALVYSTDHLQQGSDTPLLNLTILTVTPTPDQTKLVFDLTDLCKSLQDTSFLSGLNAPMSPNPETTGDDSQRRGTGSELGKNIRLGFIITREPCNSIFERECLSSQTILDQKAAPVLQVHYGSSDLQDEQAASLSQLLRDLGQ